MTREDPAKKKSPTQIPGPRQLGPLPRFLKALLFSSLASFGAATYMLNPQWRMRRRCRTCWRGWAGRSSTISRSRIPSIASRRAQNAPAATAPIAVPTGAPARPSSPNAASSSPTSGRRRCPAASSCARSASLPSRCTGQTKTPVFVAERLNRQTLAQGQGLRRTDKFYAEARLPRSERAELDD